MSRYKPIIDPIPEEEKSPQEDLDVPFRQNISLQESETIKKEASANLGRVRKFCYFMILTSFIIPVLSWFIDPYHFIFYQALIIFCMQIYVAVYGIRATKQDFFERLEYFRKIVHAFYVYFLISLVVNQIIAIIVSSEHNYKNCGTFINNRVCTNRTGLMTTQLVTLLYSPGLDFSVWIFYRYLLTILDDCKVNLSHVKIRF